MNTLEIKRTLSGIPPGHPFAQAITSLIAGQQLADLDALAGPPQAVSERDREYYAGRMAMCRELKASLAALWAPTVAAPPPEVVG